MDEFDAIALASVPFAVKGALQRALDDVRHFVQRQQDVGVIVVRRGN